MLDRPPSPSAPRRRHGRFRSFDRLPRPEAALTFAVLLLASCQPDTPDPEPEPGSAEAFPQPPAWTLGAADLRIEGDGDGGPLPSVEALVEGPDGRIHSLHERETFVRSWTSEGAPAGRPGSGAGDSLPDPRGLGLLGDTLWVMDGQSHRVRFFGPDGAPRGGLEPSIGEGAAGAAARDLPPRPIRPRGDGTFLGVTPEVSDAVARGDQRTTVLVRMEGDGSVLDTVWVRSWLPRDVLPLPREGGGAYGEQPFADAPLWSVVADGSLVVVDRRLPGPEGSPAFHVTRIAPTGDTLARATLHPPTLPLDQARIDRAASEVAERWAAFLREAGDTVVPDQLQGRIVEALYTPSVLPPVTALVPASDGSVWLRRPGAEADDTVEWWVVAPDGSLRARVPAPADLRVLWIGPDHVLGSVADSAGSGAVIVRHPIGR